MFRNQHYAKLKVKFAS